MEENTSIRLNKYIAESGLCSRREADGYIAEGRVKINGEVALMGTKVLPGDVVVVNGRTIPPKAPQTDVYIAFNKPEGVTCTTDPADPTNIVDFIKHPRRIFPIGRLDKDSQGLILLTSDGNIVNKILRAGNNHEKEYLVTVNRPVNELFLKRMSSGVPILGTVTKKCTVFQESEFTFRIILVQGLNRQIRRMCEFLDYEVVKLVRVRIMNVEIRGIETGTWRELTPEELHFIHESVKNSVGTEEASTGFTAPKPPQKSFDPKRKPFVPKR